MSLTETSYIATLVHQTDWRSLAISITVVTISSIVVWSVATYFTSPLRKYPGPGLAGKSIMFDVLPQAKMLMIQPKPGLTYGAWLL